MDAQVTDERAEFVIAQISDLHCGESRFDAALLAAVVDRTNRLCPDVVFVVGDLTANGYGDEFDEAKRWIDRIECPHKIVVPGNHDSRHVGYVYYRELFGDRFHAHDIPFGVSGEGVVQATMRVVAVDATIPDLNDAELGREHYRWVAESLRATDSAFKVFVVHHHLLPIPGTGRERNVVWDAGDVLEILEEAGVELVLSGHKHVPYVWPVAGMLAVTSGTASTWRTRGLSPPSSNVIRIRPDRIDVEVLHSADEGGKTFSYPGRHVRAAEEVRAHLETADPEHTGSLTGAEAVLVER